jgi:hypothetical protein
VRTSEFETLKKILIIFQKIQNSSKSIAELLQRSEGKKLEKTVKEREEKGKKKNGEATSAGPSIPVCLGATENEFCVESFVA